ncbi:hypothetical protein BDP55DRAFT_773959 [Colletotrichum godetiae]|uniref:Ecp2 effector protein domain-containing protein n=1 Tax=Colletotrichum godetiae TaxID=1209918 RepID=A0AAJ0A6M1_9PEZI|nr:uncharacterized protein BDP55DRAFT_773959 [Colletotrichum godetiae]KAK1657448.1 hypothetical protein BDP55DRAFT_773959 [Colletotrichum godetiae]
MQLSLYIIATLAAASAAFRVPEGATDGVYAAYYDESGNEVHVKDPNPIIVAVLVSAAPEARAVKKPGVSRARRASAPSELFARAATVWCGCGFHLNNIDCDGAVQQIKDGINGAGGQSDVGPGLAWYAIRGNVVVFLCNRYGPGRGRVTVSSFAAGLSTITSACGYYVTGTIENGVLDIGYMNNDSNVWFCERSRWSTVHEC